MAVQVVAGPVVAHRGARVGVVGDDLHVAQVSAGVGHGRDTGMTEHVRVCPGDLEADCPAGRGTRTMLVPLPHTRSTRWPCSSPKSAMSELVAWKIRKPSSPSMDTRAKSYGFGDSRAAVSRPPDCRRDNPRVDDSAGTEERRTCSAGQYSSTPSRTQLR